MIKTSETVFMGHPDKICDQVCDFLLMKLLEQDHHTRSGIECLIKDELVVVAGEVTTRATIDYPTLVRECLDNIGLDGDKHYIKVKISKQSHDIALGVDKGGAGDQGIMYGYAEVGNDSYMPWPVVLSRALADHVNFYIRENKNIFGVDGKCQVTIKDGHVTTIVVSVQTKVGVDRKVYEPFIYKAISMAIPKDMWDGTTKILINPTGEFVKGGSFADSGLSGRKLQCDSYGGLALHGGGAWSGKDFTKVDRSASYYARYIAKNIVASGLADKCEVGIAYAIGVKEPVGVSVNTFNTGILKDEQLLKIVLKLFDFTPQHIIKTLSLDKKDYYILPLLSYLGHVGHVDDFIPWEKLDKVDELKEELYNESL